LPINLCNTEFNGEEEDSLRKEKRSERDLKEDKSRHSPKRGDRGGGKKILREKVMASGDGYWTVGIEEKAALHFCLRGRELRGGRVR